LETNEKVERVVKLLNMTGGVNGQKLDMASAKATYAMYEQGALSVAAPPKVEAPPEQRRKRRHQEEPEQPAKVPKAAKVPKEHKTPKAPKEHRAQERGSTGGRRVISAVDEEAEFDRAAALRAPARRDYPPSQNAGYERSLFAAELHRTLPFNVAAESRSIAEERRRLEEERRAPPRQHHGAVLTPAADLRPAPHAYDYGRDSYSAAGVGYGPPQTRPAVVLNARAGAPAGGQPVILRPRAH